MIVPQAPGQTPNMPALGRTQARIVWFAIALVFTGVVLGAILGADAIPGAANPGLGEIFLAVGTFVVLADLGVGFFVASRIRKGAPPSANPDSVAATQVIVGAATCLSGGLVSAVFFFVSRQGLILLLAAPCALALLLWFPSESRWAALRPGPAPGAPPRNPMIRS